MKIVILYLVVNMAKHKKMQKKGKPILKRIINFSELLHD